MSIDRETFENASEDKLVDLSIPDLVLGFLATHHDRAFKAHEIASHIDVDEGAVSTALSRLKSRGLVEHKATYWAVTDNDERLSRYNGYERATAVFNEQLGGGRIRWSGKRMRQMSHIQALSSTEIPL